MAKARQKEATPLGVMWEGLWTQKQSRRQPVCTCIGMLHYFLSHCMGSCVAVSCNNNATKASAVAMRQCTMPHSHDLACQPGCCQTNFETVSSKRLKSYNIGLPTYETYQYQKTKAQSNVVDAAPCTWQCQWATLLAFRILGSMFTFSYILAWILPASRVILHPETSTGATLLLLASAAFCTPSLLHLAVITNMMYRAYHYIMHPGDPCNKQQPNPKSAQDP